MPVCLGAALLVLQPAVFGFDQPKGKELAEVVLKSLDTHLLVDGRTISTGCRFFRYRVVQVNGDLALAGQL